MAEIARIQSEMTGRMQTIGEVFGSRQADLVRLFAERLDSLQSRVGDGLRDNVKQTVDNLAKLNERLAVIDAAQKNLTDLTGQVLSLKDVLANKQTRGAFGQGRMEAIVRDALPQNAFAFQVTLSNGSRPDCVIHLPGDDRPLVVDAKFPLEGFTAFREAQGEEFRRAAGQRVRADVSGACPRHRDPNTFCRGRRRTSPCCSYRRNPCSRICRSTSKTWCRRPTASAC